MDKSEREREGGKDGQREAYKVSKEEKERESEELKALLAG